MNFISMNNHRDPSSFSQFYRNNISQFANIIEQNDMKALKKIMKKPRIAKNLDLIRSGILITFQENNCEALKILSSSPLPDLFQAGFLHRVVLTPKVDFLRILLTDKRIDVNQEVIESESDLYGVTPLMIACTGKTLEPPLMEACRDGKTKVEIVRELLQHAEIDVNAQDESKFFSALVYALREGPLDMVKMLINHKDMTEIHIQQALRKGMWAVSNEFDPLDLELLNILMKKNFENEFILKNLSDERFEFHEHLQSWIAEELEMKIREEYSNDNVDVSEESVCNKAFGFSLDILQAYILKCKCAYCSGIRHIKQQTYLDDDFDLSDHDSGYKCFKNCGLRTKDPKAKCILETKVPVLFENRTGAYGFIDFIDSTLPDLYQDILLNGGHENDLDDIVNGTITVEELRNRKESESNAKTLQTKDKADNVSIDDKNNESIGSSEVIDKSALCWSCSSTEVKLYKCSGCRKARYCSDKCIVNDWKQHANFCVKMQQKRNKKRQEILIERQLV